MSKINQKWIGQLPLENIETVKAQSGGDVNDAYYIETTDSEYFLLVQPNAKSSFYKNEIMSLEEMNKSGIAVPQVIDSGQIEGDAYLILSYLVKGVGSYSDLGRTVAKLHKQSSENNLFGFNSNHSGSTMTFDNSWTESWSELYIERRLDKMRDKLLEQGLWNKSDDEKYQKARQVMVESFENRDIKPALLHGDMWGGNHMFLEDGTPALFDPASFYGDRELDLGMSTGFGAFNSEFYQSYNEESPLDEGWEERLTFYSLYLFMVHLLKFGNIYYSSVDRDLDKIINIQN